MNGDDGQADEVTQLRADLESALAHVGQVRRAAWVAVLCAVAGVVAGYLVLSRQSKFPRIMVTVVRSGVPRYVPDDWSDDVTSADVPPDSEEQPS